jgi:putative flippase GtrA
LQTPTETSHETTPSLAGERSASSARHPNGPFASLRRALPSGEVIRFLLVGGFNTVFAFGLGMLLVHPLEALFPKLPLQMVPFTAVVLTAPITITEAFLGYKWFVFKTKGNYFNEWRKCFAVYSISIPAPLVLLPFITNLLLHVSLTRPYASPLAFIANAGMIACFSYFAHKKFSFKR